MANIYGHELPDAGKCFGWECPRTGKRLYAGGGVTVDGRQLELEPDARIRGAGSIPSSPFAKPGYGPLPMQLVRTTFGKVEEPLSKLRA